MKPARFHEETSDEHAPEDQFPDVSPEQEKPEDLDRAEVKDEEEEGGESSPSDAENS